jgi:hypothetical protein
MLLARVRPSIRKASRRHDIGTTSAKSKAETR